MRVLVERGGCPPGGWAAGQRVSLDEDEMHHIRVRRAKDGEIVEILDGAGLRGTGHLVRTGKEWWVEVQDAILVPRPAELTLAVGAGDRERFSWMVEKAVELGVTRIVPLETARTGGVATRVKQAQVSRLQRQALEATKQCGAAWAVRVEAPVSLEVFLQFPVMGSGWLADASGDPPPATLSATELAVVIGPEGGLTDPEREQLVVAGYRPTALGSQTLRFETAAIAAAALATTARARGSDG